MGSVPQTPYKKNGGDIAGPNQAMKKMSKRKGYKIKGPEYHSDQTGSGTLHYHMPDRKTVLGRKSGHAFITKMTAVGVFGDHWYSHVIDFFNPVSDINDVLDIIDELADENGDDDRCH